VSGGLSCTPSFEAYATRGSAVIRERGERITKTAWRSPHKRLERKKETQKKKKPKGQREENLPKRLRVSSALREEAKKRGPVTTCSGKGSRQRKNVKGEKIEK